MISHTLALYSLVLEDTRTRAVAVAGDKLENGVVRAGEHVHRAQSQSTQSTEHSTAAEESTELKSEHSAQARGRGWRYSSTYPLELG